MTFHMIYDKRNHGNLNKLADITHIAAYKLYQYCLDNHIQILIYETIRTVEQQRKNVASGASQTWYDLYIVRKLYFENIPIIVKGQRKHFKCLYKEPMYTPRT